MFNYLFHEIISMKLEILYGQSFLCIEGDIFHHLSF